MHKVIRKTLAVIGLLLLNAATAAADQPNIVFIFSDDHSKNAISCYGNSDIETPGLDRLAAEGMRFEHALTPNSFCTPSRAVVLTGKYSHKNGVTHLNQKFDGSQQTFPKLLQAAGYETALFGKWHLLSRPTGFDHFCVMKMQGMVFDPRVYEPQHEWIAWGPDTRKEAREGGRVIEGYNNDVLTDEALNWLTKQQGGKGEKKPFCLLIHPKPPHEPYSPPKKYEDFLEDVVIPEPRTLHDDYKGRSPEAIADIMTSNRILLNDKADKVRGASYYHFYEHGKRLPEMIGIRTETHKLIHYPGLPRSHQWEMFDLKNDPDEMNNLYGNPEHQEKRESLKHDLRALIKTLDDPVDTPTLEVVRQVNPKRDGS